MPEITMRRSGQFLRVIFELLLNKPEGLPAKVILDDLPNHIKLTEFESGYYDSAPNSPRMHKIVRFATIGPVKAGWLVKNKGRWFITEEGRSAYHRFQDPEEFLREASRLYQVWKRSRPQEEGLDDGRGRC